MFIDESGQDQRHSPYEVLAGIAVEDRRVWPLIRDLSDAQQPIFGMPLFEAYGREAKTQKLLDRKTFKHAAQLSFQGEWADGSSNHWLLDLSHVEDDPDESLTRIVALHFDSPDQSPVRIISAAAERLSRS